MGKQKMWQADQETPVYSDEDFVREERLHARRKSRVAELQAISQVENEDIGSTNSINSINSTNYIPGEISEIGLVQEFDKLENKYRSLNDETAENERQFLNICEKFQAERENWKQEQIRFHNMEHENAQLSKELNQITKKYQRISHNYEKEQIRSKTLEGKVEELEGIIELMKEIVFNDTNDGNNERRAQLSILQTSVRNQHLNYDSPAEDPSLDEITEKSNTTYEKPSDAGSESDLNQAYGDYYTSTKMKLKQEREYKQDYPVPSGFSPSTKTPKSRIPVALQSPLKSLKSSLRSASPKMSKQCHFIEQDSFVQGDIPETGLYQSPMSIKTKNKNPRGGTRLMTASEAIPTEIVLYISALQDKLDHHDLYIKTPDTEDLDLIESIKRSIRSGAYDERTVLDELNGKSTTVICQLVKDFFFEKEDKILDGGDEIFSNMLQAVRCCNDQYLMRLFKQLPENKQFQLAFLMVHLQSAVDNGRLPGELSCAFGSVVVGPGFRNKNDPKELIQKLIELDGNFFDEILNPNSNSSRVGSMLGPVDKDQASSWKNMIKAKQDQLLLKFDSKIFSAIHKHK